MTNWLHVHFLKIGLHGIAISLWDWFQRDMADLSCYSHLSSLIGAGKVQQGLPNGLFPHNNQV